MNNRLRKIGIYLSAEAVRQIPRLFTFIIKGVVTLSGIVIIPLRLFYKKAVFPILIFGYKLYIIFGERLRTFFYAQHKILALLSHRYAIHGVMLAATIGMISANVVQATGSQPFDIFSRSLINDYLGGSQDTVITADTPLTISYRYIPISNNVHIDQFTLGGSVELKNTLSGGTSIARSTLIQDAESSSEIQTYIVEGGDTISTIAKRFGVSTQTVLWSNNLNENSTIKPGQKLLILPVSGVAHTVQKDETLNSIANTYKANVSDIVAFNNLISDNDVPIGTEIIIPNGKKEIVIPPRQNTTTTGGRNTTYTQNNSYVPPSTATYGGKLQWPTTARSITCYYSYCYGGRLHTGIDIDGRTGDPIWAAESGYIKSVQYGTTGYGINILIQHDNGLVTRYAHLSKVYVSQGQRVSRGQTIAAEGNTGYSSGDHLHFEVIVNGRTQNPLNYVSR